MSRPAASAKLKLKKLRTQIDQVDRLLMKILARRFRIVCEVGHLKRQYNLPIVQKSRMTEMLKGRRADATRLKLNARLIYKIFDLIHTASIEAQEKIFKTPRKIKRRS